jgi:hypothetical protein
MEHWSERILDVSRQFELIFFNEIIYLFSQYCLLIMIRLFLVSFYSES